MEKFFHILFNDKIAECSKTPIQFEILNLKLKNLASTAFAKYEKKWETLENYIEYSNKQLFYIIKS